MTSPTGITQPAALSAFARAIEGALVEAAEPLIQQAMKDIEVTMRKRVHLAAVGLIRHGYEMNFDRDRLLISVRLDNLGGATL